MKYSFSIQNNETLIEHIIIAKESSIEPLTAFIYESGNPVYLAERLQLNQQQKEIIEGACKLNIYLKEITSNQLYKNWSPSKWTTLLEEININESSFILEIC